MVLAKKRPVDQWNKIEELNFSHFMFDRDTKNLSWRKALEQIVMGKLDVHEF